MRRRGPDPVRVTVTKRQRAALEALVNDEDARPRLRQRARIVLGAADGDSNREVAASVGVSEPTVSTWRARLPKAGWPPWRIARRSHARVGALGAHWRRWN